MPVQVSDCNLVEYVTEKYGVAMGCQCEEIFANDLKNESGFANHLRRSLARELGASFNPEASE